jgi:hypothetical protein
LNHPSWHKLAGYQEEAGGALIYGLKITFLIFRGAKYRALPAFAGGDLKAG